MFRIVWLIISGNVKSFTESILAFHMSAEDMFNMFTISKQGNSRHLESQTNSSKINFKTLPSENED